MASVGCRNERNFPTETFLCLSSIYRQEFPRRKIERSLIATSSNFALSNLVRFRAIWSCSDRTIVEFVFSIVLCVRATVCPRKVTVSINSVMFVLINNFLQDKDRYSDSTSSASGDVFPRCPSPTTSSWSTVIFALYGRPRIVELLHRRRSDRVAVTDFRESGTRFIYLPELAREPGSSLETMMIYVRTRGSRTHDGITWYFTGGKTRYRELLAFQSLILFTTTYGACSRMIIR